MEKETILIHKIKDGQFFEKADKLALEQDYEILLKNGGKIRGTCTPTHMEEFFLGARFLADDLESNESNDVSDQSLQAVDVQEIFKVAENCFETAGALFTDTGCAHSCALIHKGKVVCQMEDIGRYNALDKAIGYAVKNQIPFSESYVFASGRIALGYIQKAGKAGFPMVVSRAAVTKAAVDYAKEYDMTLIGFIRKNSGNIYHMGQVKLNPSDNS